MLVELLFMKRGFSELNKRKYIEIMNSALRLTGRTIKPLYYMPKRTFFSSRFFGYMYGLMGCSDTIIAMSTGNFQLFCHGGSEIIISIMSSQLRVLEKEIELNKK